MGQKVSVLPSVISWSSCLSLRLPLSLMPWHWVALILPGEGSESSSGPVCSLSLLRVSIPRFLSGGHSRRCGENGGRKFSVPAVGFTILCHPAYFFYLFS